MKPVFNASYANYLSQYAFSSLGLIRTLYFYDKLLLNILTGNR